MTLKSFITKGHVNQKTAFNSLSIYLNKCLYFVHILKKCFCVNTDSTRHLYERKLEKAMEQASVKTSSDKTYYREEGRKQPEVEAISVSVRMKNTKDRAHLAPILNTQTVIG